MWYFANASRKSWTSRGTISESQAQGLRLSTYARTNRHANSIDVEHLQNGGRVIFYEALLYTQNEEGVPVPTQDVLVWSAWFEKADRSVMKTTIGEALISTTFTGIDRNRSDRLWWKGVPWLWETRVFGGPYDGLGQYDISDTTARDGHHQWSRVVREAHPLERVLTRYASEKRSIDHYDPCREDETSTWLLGRETAILLNVIEPALGNYEKLGALHPRRVFPRQPEQPARLAWEPPSRHERPKAVVLYDVIEVIDLCRQNIGKAPRLVNGRKSSTRLPQHLKPAHGDLLDTLVTPVAITLLEFRVRYGYRCKRVPCIYCKDHHYAGSWGECRRDYNESGTRYCVQRADGTIVCKNIGSLGAWKMALQLEQDRLTPLLIARDAILERHFEAALKIAAELSSDLADPLRREIALAMEPTKLHDTVPVVASGTETP